MKAYLRGVCGGLLSMAPHDHPFAGPARGAVRLVGGQTDAGGAWAYGVLQVSDGSFFSGVADGFRFGSNLGRRGAAVACRSLGFETGAQIVSGEGTALLREDGTVDTMGQIICQGDETSLSECQTSVPPFFDYGTPPGDAAVALVCSSASGAMPIKPIAATLQQSSQHWTEFSVLASRIAHARGEHCESFTAELVQASTLARDYNTGRLWLATAVHS